MCPLVLGTVILYLKISLWKRLEKLYPFIILVLISLQHFNEKMIEYDFPLDQHGKTSRKFVV